MNAMRKTGLHCAGLHSKSESQSFCCSTALQHQVLLKMSAMWKLEFSGLKCTLVQVKVKVFAAANTEDECTVTAGNRCNSVRMAFVQWLRSHRPTIASPISTIAQLSLRSFRLLLNYCLCPFQLLLSSFLKVNKRIRDSDFISTIGSI